MRRLFNRHHKDAPVGVVYIGRGTPWGNPFIVGQHGARGECVELFEQHTLPELDVSSLVGKALLCSCYPDKCHGDSILRKIQELENNMSELSGVIQQIKTKKVGAQQKTAYDMQIAGQWYGYGFFAPKAKEGDYVTFSATQNGNFWNIDRGSMKVGKAPAEAAKPSGNVRAAVNTFDARQDAISRQAASNTAIAWITVLQTAGALPTGSKTKGNLQAALDTIRREYEKEFYEGNTGNEWKDISPKPKDVDPEMEFDDSEDGEDQPWE